jgi:uncharacterized protein YbjQ (UPF0145 family)
MLVATVASIEGRPVQWYLGVVTGGAMTNAGRPEGVPAGGDGGPGSHACPVNLRDARDRAICEMLREAAERGANAVIGVGLGYEPIRSGAADVTLMVTVSGTAVRV